MPGIATEDLRAYMDQRMAMGGSVGEMQHAFTSFSLMIFGAFATQGIGAFSTSPTVPQTVVVINGNRYFGLTLNEATQVEAALYAAEAARAAGVTVPRLSTAVSQMITNSAIAGMQQGVGLFSVDGLAALIAFGSSGGNSEVYDGMQGILTAGFWPGTTNSISDIPDDRTGSGAQFKVIVGELYNES